MHILAYLIVKLSDTHWLDCITVWLTAVAVAVLGKHAVVGVPCELHAVLAIAVLRGSDHVHGCRTWRDPGLLGGRRRRRRMLPVHSPL